MVSKFIFGNPYFETEAVVADMEPAQGKLPYFSQEGLSFSLRMSDDEIVYGLGENVRGINKRGFIYESFCADQFDHSEEAKSLYGAHNFLIISGKDRTFGVFFDSPGKVTFDTGYTDLTELRVTVENDGFYVYVIEGGSPLAVTEEFRKIIGQSYIPPKWAFGMGQSRWGYAGEKDARDVIDGYRKNGIPLDMCYMDIDYMEEFKDFTVSKEHWPDLAGAVKEFKEEGVRIIPIIDAAVKKQDGYDVYEEGRDNGYFCKDADGKDFVVGVWPGNSLLPDFLNEDARKWFGSKYRSLTDAGIEGFWNDMNEPALFYSEERLREVFGQIAGFERENLDMEKNFRLKDLVNGLANSMEDYRSFWHRTGGRSIRHDKVHNMYGYFMTRAAAEGFAEHGKNRRRLLFSRASYIGMHRYSGIWMGDNKSRWQHILMNLQMLPSLNMCGFMYTGADMGGFGCNTTEDLLLRWHALGIFMPLLRNHSALGTREQEPYKFPRIDAFRNIINLRYMLLPYIYSEFMKAVLKGTMYALPLGFLYADDGIARRCEDQLFIGRDMMIAPVYQQNAAGRVVYLPEEMKMVRFRASVVAEEKVLGKGHAFVDVALDEVVVFLRKGAVIPLAKPAECVGKVDWSDLGTVSFEGDGYLLYDDDGESCDVRLEEGLRVIKAGPAKQNL